MSYTKLTDFAVKDALLSGNPAKVIRGVEFDAEFNAIEDADALNTKLTVIAANDGASLVGYLPAGTGAVATTVQEALRRLGVNVKDFGAAGNGVTSDTTAFTAAITALTAAGGGALYVPAGTYMVSGLSTPDDSKIEIVGDGVASILKKNANGAMISLGKQCTLKSLAMDGNGGVYTGVGVTVTTGALDNFSWRKYDDVDIYNTASYCIEHVGNRAGYASSGRNLRLVPTSLVTYAIKMAGNGGSVESNGNRRWTDVWTYGNRIADLTDANNTSFSNCHGFWPLFTSTTHKTSWTGGRLLGYDTSDVLTGTANTIDACTYNQEAAATLTINSGALNCRFGPSVALGSGYSIVDSSTGATSGNDVWLPKTIFSTVWGGTGGTPAIGNGTLSMVYQRRGTLCQVNMAFAVGSTTAFNTATAWTFTIPYNANRTNTGSARILDSGTGYFVAVPAIITVNTIQIFTNGPGIPVGYLSPMTWATGDTMYIDFEYEIA